ELDVLADAQVREERVVLGQIADAAPLDRHVELFRGVEQHVVSNRDASRFDGQRTENDGKQAALAGAVRTDEHQGPRIAVERHVERDPPEARRDADSEARRARHRTSSWRVYRRNAARILRHPAFVIAPPRGACTGATPRGRRAATRTRPRPARATAPARPGDRPRAPCKSRAAAFASAPRGYPRTSASPRTRRAPEPSSSPRRRPTQAPRAGCRCGRRRAAARRRRYAPRRAASRRCVETRSSPP